MKAWAESEVQTYNQSCMWRELDHLEPTFVQTKVQFERLKGAVQCRRISSNFDWGCSRLSVRLRTGLEI